jgi:uncharacterized SAM-binding protein YcdF (DUF218 family)
MFFWLSKLVGFFALPSNLLLSLALAGLVLGLTAYRGFGRKLVLASLLLLAVAGWSPLGNVLIGPLENRFPAWDPARGAPDGIIVLGGVLSAEIAAARGEPSYNEAAERITTTVHLARLYPDARIVFTGGDASLFVPGMAEGDAAVQAFEWLGVPRERITVENKSRNTYENAVFTKAIVQPKPGERWLLVTSAVHMPRSMGIFRKVGFPVEAHPVDWRTVGTGDLTSPFNVLSAGLARTDAAVREYAGLLAYWLTGRTSALFPAP